MSKTARLSSMATTVSFEKFWTWISSHPNCILRAGTPEAVLVDHDDFHWTLSQEDDDTFVVQLARAKDLVGELILFAKDVAYVSAEASEHEGEFLFECIIETPEAREAAYHFVLSHEYDAPEHKKTEKWTH